MLLLDKPTDIQPYLECNEFAYFLTSDKATLKTLKRVKQCCVSGSSIMWIEGDTGTGKKHLSQIAIHEHAKYHTQNIYTYTTIVIEEHTQNLELILTSSLMQYQVLVIKLAPNITVRELQELHQVLFQSLNYSYKRKPLIIFLSNPMKQYNNDAANIINTLKQLYILNYYEFITLNALRYRRDDIELYLKYYLNSFAAACFQKTAPSLTASAMEYIQNQTWVNNVRDIQMLALSLCQNKPNATVTAEDIQNLLALTGQLSQPQYNDSTSQQWIALLSEDGIFRELHSIEKDIIEKACAFYKGCKTSVAKDLGLGRTTLYRKLKEQNIA